MKYNKYLLIAVSLVLLVGIFSFSNGFVSAEETENKGFITDGLEFKEVKPVFGENSIRFETDYLNKSLTPKQVFVPDELSDKATLSGYNYVEAPTGKLVEWTGYEYQQYADYPTEELSDLLGRGGSNTVSDSKYPVNYFQMGTYSSNLTDLNGSIEDVFDYDFVDENSDYNVSWNIEVSSHYNHLIIDYELWFSNSTTTEKVHTFQDVYSVEKPDLLPVDGQINKYEPVGANSYKDRFLMKLDNKYGDNYTANVTIAYPDNKDLWKVDFGDYNKIENRYNEVVTKANNLNKTNTLLDTTDGYTIKSYSVEIPKNQTKPLSYFIDSKKGEYNDLRMWVEGSFAGGSGTSDDPYQIESWSHLNETRDDLDASYELMNDLNSSTAGYDTYASENNPFKSIGRSSGFDTPFTGTFNGNNHKIEDINYNTSQEAGLFGGTDENAELSNLSIVNATIEGDVNYPSLFIGYTEGNTIIENIYVQGIINSPSDYQGLLVGYDYSSNTVINSVTVNGTIINDATCTRVGGMVGVFGSSNNINNSKAYINITTPNCDYVGGLVGEGAVATYGIIDNSYAQGYIEGNDEVGGVIGRTTDTMSENTFSNVTVIGNNMVGGFLGRISTMENTIKNSYAFGSVEGNDKVGGFGGVSATSPFINKTYTSCDVNGNTNTSGFIGYDDSTGLDIDNSFWDVDTSDIGNSGDDNFGATGKTTSEMQSIETFNDTSTEGLDEAWDMVLKPNHDGKENTATWFIDDGNDYPRLFFEYEESDTDTTSDVNITVLNPEDNTDETSNPVLFKINTTSESTCNYNLNGNNNISMGTSDNITFTNNQNLNDDTDYTAYFYCNSTSDSSINDTAKTSFYFREETGGAGGDTTEYLDYLKIFRDDDKFYFNKQHSVYVETYDDSDNIDVDDVSLKLVEDHNLTYDVYRADTGRYRVDFKINEQIDDKDSYGLKFKAEKDNEVSETKYYTFYPEKEQKTTDKLKDTFDISKPFTYENYKPIFVLGGVFIALVIIVVISRTMEKDK